MIKLNLGAGKTNFGPEWVNIDCIKAPHIKYHDITQLPFKDRTVDLVYSSHALEYFDRQEVVPVLIEWYRVLKKGGIIRLAVPDWKALVDIYNDTGELRYILGPLFGRIPVRKNKYIYHKTVWNFRDLSKVLEDVGFQDVRKWDFKTVPPHDKIDDCSRAFFPHDAECIRTGKFRDDQIHVSLNVEAYK